jgi:hypothetical protein
MSIVRQRVSRSQAVKEKDSPDRCSGKVLEYTLRNVDPALCAARAGILYFGNQAFPLVWSSVQSYSEFEFTSHSASGAGREQGHGQEHDEEMGKESDLQLSCSLCPQIGLLFGFNPLYPGQLSINSLERATVGSQFLCHTPHDPYPTSVS